MNARVTGARYEAGPPNFWGGVYDAMGHLQQQCLRPNLVYRPADPPRLPVDFAPSRTISEAAYAGRFFEHFGHFLIETSPELYAAAAAHEMLLAHPWQGVSAERIGTDFRGVLLAALGIQPARIVFADAPLIVERLLLPELPPPPQSGAVGVALLEAHACIRAYALARGAAGEKRVYLSRRKFQSDRQIANEAAVEAHLAARGFTVIHPETLSIMEQVRAVAGAELLIGVDGSALHLSSFMPTGGCVVFIDTRPDGENRDAVPFPKPFIALQVINAAVGLETKAVLADKNGSTLTFDPSLLVPYI